MAARFAERTAIVTGSGNGIGAAIARRIAEEGARVVAMTRVMAVDLAQHNIRVNAIAPGPIA